MAKKKLTMNSLMKSIPDCGNIEFKPEGECFKDVTLQVRTMLPLGDALSFVKDVASTCIDEENAEYMPELFDFAKRLYVVLYYANIDLTNDCKKAYQILYGTTLYHKIYARVNNEQASELIAAAKQRIENWRNILASTAAGKVADMMFKLEEVMAGGNELLESIDTDGFKDAVSRLVDSGVMNEEKPDNVVYMEPKKKE